MSRSRRGTRTGSNGKRGRAFRWVERLMLSAGMSLAAFVLERRLLKAIKRGSVEPAPRTAGPEPSPPNLVASAGALTTAPDQIGHQAGR